MAYVYRHIRLDKNEVFYIGIGSDVSGRYARAYKTESRNRHWHNIVNKAGYRVEIIEDGIEWDQACQKEVEHIRLYGRKDIGKGMLVNLTDGGGGAVGLITSEETKQKQSLKKIGKPASNKGKPMPKHQLENLMKINKGRVPWNKGMPLSEERKSAHSRTLKSLYKDKPGPNKGKVFSEEARRNNSLAQMGRTPWNKGKKMPDDFILRVNRVPRKTAKIIQKLDVNLNVVEEYLSLGEAARQMNIAKQSISWALKSLDRNSKGFKWRYKKETVD